MHVHILIHSYLLTHMHTYFNACMQKTRPFTMNCPQYEGEPQGYTQALDYLNIFFTGIFALEFLFKIAAFRFKVRPTLSILFSQQAYSLTHTNLMTWQIVNGTSFTQNCHIQHLFLSSFLFSSFFFFIFTGFLVLMSFFFISYQLGFSFAS